MQEIELKAFTAEIDVRKFPYRDTAILLLAIDKGLTPAEIAWLRWRHLKPGGGEINGVIDLSEFDGRFVRPRKIPIAEGERLHVALRDLWKSDEAYHHIDAPVIVSQKSFRHRRQALPLPMKPNSITNRLGFMRTEAKIPEGVHARGERHEFVVRTAQSGLPVDQVLALAGLSSARSLQPHLKAAQTTKAKEDEETRRLDVGFFGPIPEMAHRSARRLRRAPTRK